MLTFPLTFKFNTVYMVTQLQPILCTLTLHVAHHEIWWKISVVLYTSMYDEVKYGEVDVDSYEALW